MASVCLGVRERGGRHRQLTAPLPRPIGSSGTWKERALNLGGCLQHSELGYSGRPWRAWLKSWALLLNVGVQVCTAGMCGCGGSACKDCLCAFCLDLCSATEGMHH